MENTNCTELSGTTSSLQSNNLHEIVQTQLFLFGAKVKEIEMLTSTSPENTLEIKALIIDMMRIMRFIAELGRRNHSR